MRVDGDGSGQATLGEADGLAVAPLDDAVSSSPFESSRQPATELLPLDDAGVGSSLGRGRQPATALAHATAAALQRRIGAPRGSARWTAAAHDVATAPPAAVAGERAPKVPARSSASRASTQPAADTSLGKPSRVRDPEHHGFSGTVSVTVGPLGDLDPIGEFAEALTSIPGVGSVRIRTFDRASVVFDVDLTEPTALIASLRSRSYRPLRLLHANDRIIRFKLA